MATNLEPTNGFTESTFIILSEEVHLDISLIGTEYKDGTVVRNYTINLAERVHRLPSTSSTTTTISNARSQEYVIGYITFNPLPAQTTSERLKVYCDPYLTDNEAYTVHGDETDSFSDIVGILFSIFLAYAFPAETLSEIVASTIVGFFGGKITATAIGTTFTEIVAVEATSYIKCPPTSIQTHIMVFLDASPPCRVNTLVSGSMKGQRQIHGKMKMHLQFGVGMIYMVITVPA